MERIASRNHWRPDLMSILRIAAIAKADCCHSLPR
ncbi:hypothetical protein GALL_238240 [mine drainage metagenome]|uniref:Uncharacterized protein n=1 Tax=mine drainage metagenome TaxID=410659 RepID=A0A1J5RXJ4_9ZZZZ